MNSLADRDKLLRYLEKHTIHVNDCWLYNGGSKDKSGYRKIKVDGRLIGIHRLSAHIFLRLNLNDNKQQANHKHECTSKVCWNPEHLYVGTHEQNIKDYLDDGHYNSKKVYCKAGHLLTKSTTTGKRQCRICKNIKSRDWHKSKQVKIKARNSKNV